MAQLCEKDDGAGQRPWSDTTHHGFCIRRKRGANAGLMDNYTYQLSEAVCRVGAASAASNSEAVTCVAKVREHERAQMKGTICDQFKGAKKVLMADNTWECHFIRVGK